MFWDTSGCPGCPSGHEIRQRLSMRRTEASNDPARVSRFWGSVVTAVSAVAVGGRNELGRTAARDWDRRIENLERYGLYVRRYGRGRGSACGDLPPTDV